MVSSEDAGIWDVDTEQKREGIFNGLRENINELENSNDNVYLEPNPAYDSRY